MKKGDHPNDPLELIVRRVDDQSQFHEEIVLRIGPSDPADPKAVEKQVNEAVKSCSKPPIQPVVNSHLPPKGASVRNRKRLPQPSEPTGEGIIADAASFSGPRSFVSLSILTTDNAC